MGYKDVILATPGLKDYWRMGAGTSEVSIGPNAATLTHTGTPGTAASLVPTDGTGSRTYDGSTQLSTLTSYTGWASAPGISMECWFKDTGVASYSPLMGHENYPTARFFMLRNNTASQITAGFADSLKSIGIDCNANAAPFVAGTANHCVVTMGAGGLLVYINGKLGGWNFTALPGGSTSAWSIPVGIGGAGSAAWIGAIDEPAFYNVELSPGTIARHYRAGVSSGIMPGRLNPV